jgi:hypothetical protein
MDFCFGYPLSSDNPTEIFIHIKKRGCLSHPGAREWLMRDVIQELDRITTLELTEEQECYIDGIREAIALIRGVKE